MPVLNYTVLTDPAPLEASVPGQPTQYKGTVYLVVTNTRRSAGWTGIEVKVSHGTTASDLTSDPAIDPSTQAEGTFTDAQSVLFNPTQAPTTEQLVVGPGANGFDVAFHPASGLAGDFEVGDCMMLKLKNLTIAPHAGETVLVVKEHSNNPTGGWNTSYAVVPVVKVPAKPRNFRPDQVVVKAQGSIQLSWEGSDTFTYKILYPGASAPVTVSGGQWSPPAPERTTTYTLIATDPSTQQTYTLSTTVQVSNPILPELTVTTGIDTPWIQGTTDKGRLTFAGTGADLSDTSHAPSSGTLTAQQANLTNVTAQQAQVSGDLSAGNVNANSITAGISIKTADLTADNAEFDGVRTNWVRGRNADDGGFSFREEGVNLHQGAGTKRGILYALYLDVEYVKTRILRGQGDEHGWIGFRDDGVNIHRGRSTTPGIVYLSDIVKVKG